MFTYNRLRSTAINPEYFRDNTSLKLFLKPNDITHTAQSVPV